MFRYLNFMDSLPLYNEVVFDVQNFDVFPPPSPQSIYIYDTVVFQNDVLDVWNFQKTDYFNIVDVVV